MELILTDFAAQPFGIVVLSSVSASIIGGAAWGDDPFLTLPASALQFAAATLHERQVPLRTA